MCRYSHEAEQEGLMTRRGVVGPLLTLVSFPSKQLPGVKVMGFVDPQRPNCFVCIPDGARVQIHTPSPRAFWLLPKEPEAMQGVIDAKSHIDTLVTDSGREIFCKDLPVGTNLTILSIPQDKQQKPASAHAPEPARRRVPELVAT